MTITRSPPVADLDLSRRARPPHTWCARDRPGWSPDLLPVCLAALREAPAPHDERLQRLADALGLSDAELLTVALCLAADSEPAVARALAETQAPIGGSRPLAGLLASVLAPLGATVASLACGVAVGCGLLRLGEEAAALAERSLSLPLHMTGVLTGHIIAWEQVRMQAPVALPLPEAIRAEAIARARAVGAIPRAGLVLRCAAAGEALAVAHEVAAASAVSRASKASLPAASRPG